MKMRLRQIVLATADLAATEDRIVDELGLELCYRDPGVATFGLRNAFFPVGDKLLEVVSPVEEGTAAGRLLAKRGGDTGYMVMLQVDDLDAVRERIAQAGVRIVFEADGHDIVDLHLHPADVGGTILAIDRTETWTEWAWAGPEWRQHVRTDLVDDVLAVEIEATDPPEMAARWAAVLGRPVAGDPPTIVLDEGEIRFVPSAERGEGVAAFELRAAPGSDPVDTVIAGTRITSR
jgi:catechol 2,3-dioxygenase-like lactoylglutathione lyase family enzyme